MAGWFDSQGIDIGAQQPQGAPGWLNDASRYRTAGAGTLNSFAGADPRAGGGAAQNDMGGGGSDPFAYTGGSLLTPWTQKFEWGGGTAGAYSPPEHQAFNFGQFDYRMPEIGRFHDKAPTAERYQDFAAPDTVAMEADAGYQLRKKEDQRAIQNSAAARGTLLSGATMTALQDRAQARASDEYSQVYGRALNTYGTNRDTAQQHFGNQMSSYGGNLNAFSANTQAALGQGQLGLQAATGAWDRNYNLARTQWQDQADAANRAASAAASNSGLSYNQALQQYKLEHDIFQTNQANQFNRLYSLGQMGMQGAGQAGAYGSSYANNAGSIYGQQANANAAGSLGASNALAQGLGGAANAGLGAYYAGQPTLMGGY